MSRILAPSCVKLGLIDISAIRKLMVRLVRLDAATKAIRRLN